MYKQRWRILLSTTLLLTAVATWAMYLGHYSQTLLGAMSWLLLISLPDVVRAVHTGNPARTVQSRDDCEIK